MIRQYYIALVILFDRSYENRGVFDQQTGYLQQTYKSVSDSISELLSFIEERFSAYISLDDRVPLAYLLQTKEELRARVEDLKVDLVEAVGNKDLTNILLHSLYGFTNETPKRQVTFREVFYKKDLVTEIEKIHNLAEEYRKHDALIDCLVCLNFNSRAFMNYYTQKVAQRVNAYGSLKEKMTQLLLCYKEFNQMHHKSSVRLNPSYEGIKKVVGNWFAQEITYLEKKHHWNVSPLVPDSTTIKDNKPEPFKILCFLSVDQIAIILRGLDSLRIVKARSMNQVFQTIAPFLSTPRKEQISWESMRSKAYNFEESDKKAVIKVLHSLIQWIEEP